MAYPVILINSATGSNTAASGAGPDTPLTGTSASTSGDGLTVTLDGSPDLTGVATDGSHVIYVNFTTTARCFAAITAANNTTKTVTVATAFTASQSGKTWAIGGRRASLFGGTSARLIANNPCDVSGGWTIEFQSGHTETFTSTQNIYASGSTSTGPVTIRGAAGAATMPVLTQNFDEIGFTTQSGFIRFQAFEMRCSAASPTQSRALRTYAGLVLVEGMKFNHSNRYNVAVYNENTGITIVGCDISTRGDGIQCSSNEVDMRVLYNYIHGCGGNGITFSGSYIMSTIVYGNVIAGNTGRGIYSTADSGSFANRLIMVAHNTIDGNGSDGYSSADSSGYSMNPTFNNIFSNNGGYGLNFSGITNAALSYYGPFVRGNNTYGNTSGAYHSSAGAYTNSNCPWASGDPGLNPTYTNTSGNDYSIGTNLKGQGWPLGGTLAVGGASATASYVDPGAAQRQEAAATTYIFGGEF